MNSQNLGYMVVTNRGEFAGLFSERDYAQKVALMGKSGIETELGEVANKELPRLEMKDSLEKSMYLMNCYKTTYLPVFNHFEFKGVVTLNDVVKEVLENSDHEVVKEHEEAYA
jgi:predicted transcriptional regulator